MQAVLSFQKRSFTATRRANERSHFFIGNIDTDIFQRMISAIIQVQILNADMRLYWCHTLFFENLLLNILAKTLMIKTKMVSINAEA